MGGWGGECPEAIGCVLGRWAQRGLGLDHLIFVANSENTDRAFPTSWVGTNSSYTVSSKEVCAFWQAPNSAPMLSRKRTMSWLLYFCSQTGGE